MFDVTVSTAQDPESPGGTEQGEGGSVQRKEGDGSVHGGGAGLLQQDPREGGSEDKAGGPETAASRAAEDGAGRYMYMYIYGE